MFEIIEKKGKEGVAFVYLLKSKTEKGVYIECVESLDPPTPPEEKRAITLSSQKGCPCGCVFCDAGFYHKGNLSKEELRYELDTILSAHKNDGFLKSKKIKLHFARMGEPSFNDDILEFLREIHGDFKDVSFIPAIATLGPKGRDEWFEKLMNIKDDIFGGGRFQLQFSMNTTDEAFRDTIMPIKKIPFKEIAAFGQRWFKQGDRKITLNFAPFEDAPFDAGAIIPLFPPDSFLVKLTPLNPTISAFSRKMKSDIGFDNRVSGRIRVEWEKLEAAGFRVILSVGSHEEIETGSNCGQMAFAHKLKEDKSREMGL